MGKDYILTGYSTGKLVDDAEKIAELYREYGIVIFPDLLKQDPTFLRYQAELRTLMGRVIRRSSNVDLPSDIGDLLATLYKVKALDGRILADLGTMPNKFFSFNQLKYAGWVDTILQAIYGPDAIMLTPHAGDTLHFFMPDKSMHRYNLPAHQDYQYLMQSPKQVTFYIGLSDYRDNVGHLRIWEKSHHLGILKCTKNQYGSYEICDWDSLLAGYASADYTWNAGDFAIFDSLLAHASIPNTSGNAGRVVQIYRYSDVNDPVAEANNYYSTIYDRRGVLFSDAHADLYVPQTTS